MQSSYTTVSLLICLTTHFSAFNNNFIILNIIPAHLPFQNIQTPFLNLVYVMLNLLHLCSCSMVLQPLICLCACTFRMVDGLCRFRLYSLSFLLTCLTTMSYVFSIFLYRFLCIPSVQNPLWGNNEMALCSHTFCNPNVIHNPCTLDYQLLLLDVSFPLTCHIYNFFNVCK